jgi:hypothetical protein
VITGRHYKAKIPPMLTPLQLLGRTATIAALVMVAWIVSGSTAALLVLTGAAVAVTIELLVKRKA